jgi:hypothetical protein
MNAQDIAWVMPGVAVGGVLVNAGIAWAAVSRIEGLDSRLRAVEQHAAALQATLDGRRGGE